MTRITTCPQCKTRFRVTAEQLAARRGDVRCGLCTHIFNAHATLAEEMPEPEPPQNIVAPEPRAVSEQTSRSSSEAIAAESFTVEETESLPEEPLIDFKLDTSTEIESVTESTVPSVGPQAETRMAPEPEPESTAEIRVVRVQSPPLTIETRVSPDSPKYGPPPKPKRAWPWVLGSLLLLVGLAGQGIYSLRDAIAANYPPIRPLLEQACGYFQCRIGLPQQPDLLNIESSELHADPTHTNIVVLTSTLRNRASHVQAYPTLELTLTNIKDEMVARRIFTPMEYVRPRENVQRASAIVQGIPAKGDVAIKLLMDLGELKAEGYRLYLFYPS